MITLNPLLLILKPHFKKGGLLVAFFIFITPSFGQSYLLKATLYEMDSFSKVPFAVVSLKGKMTATTSDEAGYFEIQCNITDTLVLGHVTYQRTYISIKKLVESSGKNIKIYLKRKLVELVPVTITGKRLSQEKKEEYQRHLERSRPSISSPISMIYESVSRKGKERSKMDAIYQELILRDELEKRLPPSKLFIITNDRSVKLDDLLLLCPVNNYFVSRATDYEFFFHFSRCWDEYEKQK